MKKLFLFVICLCCLNVSAQYIRKNYTFRFDNPESLHPSVTRSPYSGGAVSVTDMVFTSDDGQVTISFVKGSSVIGAEIITDNEDGGRIPYLTYNTGVIMIVSSPNPESSHLVEFKTPSYDAIGGVYLQDIEPKSAADFKRDSSPDSDGIRYYRWQGNATKLSFYNGGQSPTLHQLTVGYEVEPLNLFQISSVAPAEGVVSSLDNVVITFPSAVGSVDATKHPTLTGRNGNVITGNASKEGANTVKISFSAAVASDVYTLTIPEGMVKDAADKYYNPTAKYTYNVGDVASDELVAKAQQLLAQTGVGYPTATSSARAALAALTPSSSTSAYSTAIANYVASSEIEYPANGFYYKVHAVAADGRCFYLKYDGFTVSLSSAASDAALLLFSAQGGSYTLTTADGKYLLLPGSSSTGVSDGSTADNLFALAKYPAGSSPEATFGLLSLSSGGKYASVNCLNSTLAIPASELVFSGQQTCAFAIEQAADSEIPVPEVTYSVTPESGSTVTQLTEVTIAFTAPAGAAVSVGNSSLISLSNAGGSSYKPQSVTPLSANKFSIRFTDVKAGAYTLTIGKGAFTYPFNINGNTITASVQQMTLRYTVQQGDDFQADLMSKFLVYDRDGKSADEAMKDTLLNRFAFYTYDTELGCDPTKTVEIINYNTAQRVRSGHFVATTDPKLPGASVAELRLDTPISYGGIQSGLYVIVIPEAAIGDKNFKSYLEGKPVAKHDCHVNYSTSVYKTVNNSYTPAPTPDKPSDAVMAKARAALAKSGIGYPSADAPSRAALQRLVSGGVGTDDEFNKAIQAYFAETSIQLPAAGKWYKVAAVTANAAKKAYLQTAGTLTADESQAGAFKAGGSGNTLTFATIDGQYLTVQPAGVADAPASLTVSRYPVTGGNAESTFGMMTIQKDGLMLRVNVATLNITASGSQAVFTDTETSAVQFTETTEPQADPAPEVEYELSPKDGEISGKQFAVTLTFKNISDVLADQSKIKLTNGAEAKVASVTTKDQKVFTANFGDLNPGTYTLLMEQGAFTYKFKNRTETVPAITATYTVPEKKGPSEEVLKEAEKWLAKKGLGYPAASSPARVALQQLLAAKEASDEEFNAAIANYLAEEDIELPVTGRFYRIKASTKNNSYNMYVSLKANAQDNGLRLDADAANAAVFMATVNADKTVTFMTLTEKYLSLPKPGDCLAQEYAPAAHNLKLSRLSVAGVDAKETFGLMSISLAGKYASMFLLGNPTYKDPAETPVYEKFTTSAVTLEEVDASTIEIPEIYLDYTVTPNEKEYTVTVLDKFVLTFLTNKDVSLADKSKISLTNGMNNEKMYDVKSVREPKPNTFNISFPYVKEGIYDLVIEEGAFKVNFMGRDVDVQKIEVKGIFATKDNKNGDDDIPGDVNADEAVNVADISAIIDVMAGYDRWDREKADVNGDGAVNVADISEVINIMAQ